MKIFAFNPHTICANTLWFEPVDLDRPSTFATLAMDTDIKEKVKNDLDSFVASRDYYLSVGKARKRGLEVIVGGNGDIDYLVELHDRESAEHTKGLARDNHHGYRKEGQHWFSDEFSSINVDFSAPVCRPAPTPAPSTADEIDLEFIAALPPDIQAEVLAQQCAQRVAHQTKGQPVDMDNASIIATFPADLCEEANNHYPGVRCIHYTGPGPNANNCYPGVRCIHYTGPGPNVRNKYMDRAVTLYVIMSPSLGDVATVRTGSTIPRLTTIHTEIHVTNCN
nr:E3 ubiquitin-protein ligase UPL1 isoform X1 [Tanacetum cinerariifolium]